MPAQLKMLLIYYCTAKERVNKSIIAKIDYLFTFCVCQNLDK